MLLLCRGGCSCSAGAAAAAFAAAAAAAPARAARRQGRQRRRHREALLGCRGGDACKAKLAVYHGATLVIEPWKSSRADESLSKTLHVSGFGAQVPDETGLKKAIGAVPAFTATIKPMCKFALVTLGDAEAVEALKAGSVAIPVQLGLTLLAELSGRSAEITKP